MTDSKTHEVIETLSVDGVKVEISKGKAGGFFLAGVEKPWRGLLLFEKTVPELMERAPEAIAMMREAMEIEAKKTPHELAVTAANDITFEDPHAGINGACRTYLRTLLSDERVKTIEDLKRIAGVE